MVDLVLILFVSANRTTGIDFFSDLSNPMVMRTYYTRIFPFKQTFNWLNQSRGKPVCLLAPCPPPPRLSR